MSIVVHDVDKEQNTSNRDFSKLRVGLKTLEDAVYELNVYEKIDPRLGNKHAILRAIHHNDLRLQREISNFFFKTSGIYARLVRYLANLYRYDWFVTPYINSDNLKREKILKDFHAVLNFCDDFGIKQYLENTALDVVLNGVYYGYKVNKNENVAVQQLPPNYCRSRFKIRNHPVVEFNMKFFDDMFKDTEQKIKMLNFFPPEFKKGYILYKEGKLKPDFKGDTNGWYMLDPELSVKFSLNGDSDSPYLLPVIPALIDLAEAQELDQKKMKQKLLKIIIQQLPLDKNGDPLFSIGESREMHNNAVNMLGKAIGVDVLTTFADTQVADMADKNTTTSTDELEKVERTVFNEAGVSQMQFNTDGNIALEKSILNDEASLHNLLLQFEDFLNMLLKPFNKYPKKMKFRLQILSTTIYNYKDMAKLYKEQTQLGYSKMLPQICLGQSQSSILANAFFENDILDLVNVFIPPMSSNTMSADVLQREVAANKQKEQNSDSDSQGGRPTNESKGEEVTEKTIQNKESEA